MKKIMKIWAKISSIVLIYFAIYSTYLGIKLIYLTSNLTFRPTPIKTPILLILVTLSSLGTMIIFYGPLFYYAWIKRPKNEIMKMWAKILTIIIPVLAIISFIVPWSLEFPKNILSTLPIFILIAPLYYYAWN